MAQMLVSGSWGGKEMVERRVDCGRCPFRQGGVMKNNGVWDVFCIGWLLSVVVASR